MGRDAGARVGGEERAANRGAAEQEAGAAGRREARSVRRGLRDVPHGQRHRQPGADGQTDVRDAQLGVSAQLLRALRERALPHRGRQLRHADGEAEGLLPERQGQQDGEPGHAVPVLRLPGEGGHCHHGAQRPRDIRGGGVLPLRDRQRLLEPADGVHAELHGEPHSRHPVCVWHQARRHLQPCGHNGSVHGAVQQDPQAAAGACSRNQMKGLLSSVRSSCIFSAGQESLQKAALRSAQGSVFLPSLFAPFESKGLERHEDFLSSFFLLCVSAFSPWLCWLSVLSFLQIPAKCMRRAEPH